MARQPINFKTESITSILGGFSDIQYQPSKSSYHGAVGIDPDFVLGNGKASGAIIPISYQKFSGANLTGHVKWMTTNPKNTLTYTYCSDGKVISYDSSLANETVVGTPTSGAGNGMTYYNNYLYFATPTDITRYGPLNGSPSLTNNYWTSTLSKTALTNTTYPTVNGVVMPNHPMHVHGDNFLYLGDFVNGQGYIHKIRTYKVTVEGDTDNGSAYGVMLLPFGFMPTSIESYGFDVIITAIQTTSTTVNQGSSAIFLWNPVEATFYRGPIYLPDPLATATLSLNGILYIWSGSAYSGCRISRYTGGDGIVEVLYQEEGISPLAGAVSSLGNRLCWGANTINPTVSASVYAYGSKISSVPKVLHNIVNTTSVGANPLVTAITNSQQTSSSTNRVIVAWKDDSGVGIDRLADTSVVYNSMWRSNFTEVGQKFFIKQIRIPLGATLAAGMTITPKIWVDDFSQSFTLNTINSTNYSGRKVIYKQPELVGVEGTNDFLIEFTFTGTVALPLIFPIEITYEFYLDENSQ